DDDLTSLPQNASPPSRPVTREPVSSPQLNGISATLNAFEHNAASRPRLNHSFTTLVYRSLGNAARAPGLAHFDGEPADAAAAIELVTRVPTRPQRPRTRRARP